MHRLSPLFLATILSFQVQGQAIDHTPTGPRVNESNLTDEDKVVKDTFIHEGMAARKMKELCSVDRETERACLGRDVDPKFLGMRSSLVKALSKAYTMVIGAGAGGGLTMVKPSLEVKASTDSTEASSTSEASNPDTADTSNNSSPAEAEAEAESSTPESEQAEGGEDIAQEGNQNTDKAKEEQNNTDYCKWVAVGTEAISLVQQQVAQDNLSIPVNQETAQKELLYRAARSHGERAKTAKVQANGWGITTACYGVMMMRPSVSKSSWGNWLKLGSSALLTAFFASEVGAHEKYEKKVKAIADKLPGVGECNPITQRHCYCSQEETMNDPKYCISEIYKRAVAAGSLPVSCVDENMRTDPSCKCIGSNTCLDKKFLTSMGSLDLGQATVEGAFKPGTNLFKGELQGGSLRGGGLGQAAKGRSILNQLKDKIPTESIKLSQSQAKEAEAIESLGIPKTLAQKIAATPLSPQAQANMKRFQAGPLNFAARSRGARGRSSSNNVLSFSGGHGLNQKKAAKKSNQFAFLNKLGKKKKQNNKTGEVLNFANKAQAQAEISRNTDRDLFDIISIRYQRSGWRRLQYRP